jgi:phytoene synthase
MRGEPDRYLAATLAPKSLRPALAALAAFAAEVGRIPEQVSEAMLGEIRLQWWRDALVAGAGGERSGHPVADAVVSEVLGRGVPFARLDAVITAREFDLAGGLVADDAGLFAYIDKTDGALFEAGFGLCGGDGEALRPIALAAGRSYGIARRLGMLPKLLHNGGFPLPASRLRDQGLEPDHLVEQREVARTAAAVSVIAEELRALVRDELATVRHARAGLTGAQRAVLLPLAMIEPYFKAQSGRRLIAEMTDVAPFSRVVRLAMAHFTGRI